MVLLFHAGFSWAKGGFIGVDMFFVISGYLITAQTLKSANESKWSARRFYGRRIQRLLPSLFVTVLATLIAGTFILSNADLLNLVRSAITSILMVPNIGFWMESGYFDQAAATKPLLHTWSLGVEEQFYLLWPFVMLELARLGRPNVIIGIVIVGAISFVAAYLVFPEDASAVFFLAPYRVFQFAIGAVLAAAMRPSDAPLGAPLGLLAVAGMLALAETLDGNADIFLAMLAPAVLAGSFIAVARAPVIMHIFASAPFVWIGQRSYAIYLAHWPMMVLWLMATDYRFTPLEAVAACLLSIGAGAALHALVETPLRITDRDTMIKTPTKFLATGLLLALILGTSILIYTVRGPQSVSDMETDASLAAESVAANPPVIAEDAAARSGGVLPKRCFMMADTEVEQYDIDMCAKFSGKRPSYLIIGDSYAGDLYVALSTAYRKEADIGYYSVPGCPMIAPNDMSPTGRSHCQKFYYQAFSEILPATKPTGVILTSNWDKVPDSTLLDLISLLEKQSVEVYVVGMRTRFADRVPNIISQFGDRDAAKARVNKLLDPGMAIRNDEMHDAIGTKAHFVDLFSILCPDTCLIRTDDGSDLYKDYTHFTLEGSTWIGRQLHKTLGLEKEPPRKQ
tara:strand:- start:20130 stop:22004 length:1875 start_codon:yes stop_codon:yes gene_type:complete